jgi:hypothetical protein
MIHTITSDCSLWKIHNRREWYLLQAEKRNAVRLLVSIVICVAVLIWRLHG